MTDPRELRRCSNCSGRGRVNDYSMYGMECGVCKGAGKVQKGSPFAIPWDSERNPCSACHGTGKVTVWSR